MELRQYLNILLRRWWVILPLMFISLTGSLVFAYSRTPIYESSSRYVTTLGSNVTSTTDSTIFAVDTLTGRQRIFVTYCEILISDRVRQQVYTLLGLDATDKETAKMLSKYKVVCANLPETNVLLLTVQGKSPVLVTRMNEAIGLVGMGEANRLFPFFPLERLDVVFLEDKPVSPQYVQVGALGGVFGLIVGVTSALMMEYLRRPSERIAEMSIRNLEIGIYNERYFRQRFAEELNRASIRMRPICMAVLKLRPNEDFPLIPESSQKVLIRGAALRLDDNIGQGNMVAFLRGMTFGILLAEMPGEEAVNVINRLHIAMRSQPFESDEGFITNFSANSGVVASSGSLLGFNDMYDKAMEALRVAEQNGENTVHLINATPPPFLSTQETQQVDLTSPKTSAFTAFGENSDYGGWGLEDDAPPAKPTGKSSRTAVKTLDDNAPTVTLESSGNLETLLDLADEVARPEPASLGDTEEKKREDLRSIRRNANNSLLRRLTDKETTKSDE